MIISLISILFSFVTLVAVLLIFIFLRDQKNINKGNAESFFNQLGSFSKDLNEIENQLLTVTTPINELNKFLGGNVTAGRLGEWNLESLVSEIIPKNSYDFQVKVNSNSQDLVDCIVKTAQGQLIPIDSKLYAGVFRNFQDSKYQDEKKKILNQFKNTILKDAKEISEKYIVKDITTDYALLYLASEKINDFVDEIEGLRQDIFTNHRILIQGPNSLAAFLDTIRIGHHYLSLNETANNVAKIIRAIKKQFDNFDSSADQVLKRLDLSISDVESLQTRVNVLRRELSRGVENLDKSMEQNDQN